ncbi:type II toxin-antitoxin system VapC family toxin [Nocardioides hungaricus]
MIILDTNVVSELMRVESADARVRTWLRSLGEQPVTTVITRAEILAGIEVLPPGARRDDFGAAARAAFEQWGRCLPFTAECADDYARLAAIRRAQGRPLVGFDGLIAAIAVRVDATVATRDVGDFEGLGLDLVDPWAGPTRRR